MVTQPSINPPSINQPSIIFSNNDNIFNSIYLLMSQVNDLLIGLNRLNFIKKNKKLTTNFTAGNTLYYVPNTSDALITTNGSETIINKSFASIDFYGPNIIDVAPATSTVIDNQHQYTEVTAANIIAFGANYTLSSPAFGIKKGIIARGAITVTPDASILYANNIYSSITMPEDTTAFMFFENNIWNILVSAGVTFNI